MLTAWTRGLKQEEKNDYERRVWRAKPVLDKVVEVINSEVKSIDDTERDPKAYDNPSWAYKQAYKNGVRAGLSIIKQLVDLTNQKKPMKE